jgi:hypothetical protein
MQFPMIFVPLSLNKPMNEPKNNWPAIAFLQTGNTLQNREHNFYPGQAGEAYMPGVPKYPTEV